MTIEKEILMESIRNIQNFKRFLELNKDKLYAIAEDANSIRIDDEWMQEDIWDEIYECEEKAMRQYNIGELWWTQFPFEEIDKSKQRPAIIIDSDTIAILSAMVTSKDKKNPYSIKIDEWEKAGLKKESWVRIDRIVRVEEWRLTRKIGVLTESDFNKVTQLVAECLSEKFHEFSLLAIRNPSGKYLQVYDNNWECWLFPYCKTQEPNKENVDRYANSLLRSNTTTSYVALATHCKYSEKDKVYKRYKHLLYKIDLSDVPEHMNTSLFELKNIKYSWKSIKELESDNNVMTKNDDIIAFVKANIS